MPSPLEKMRGVHGATFKFEVTGQHAIGSFMEVSGLQVEVEVETYVEGGTNGYEHTFPGHLKYPNIVLKRGLTDAHALFDWFASVAKSGFPELQDGSITMVDSVGSQVRIWNLSGVFPVRWTGPTLAADSKDVAVEELEISHTGFLGG